MRKLVLLIMAASLFTGCATAKNAGIGGAARHDLHSKSLAQALGMLAKGDSPGAVKKLRAICAGSAVPGVTDEALFRLALLSLKPNEERPASGEARRLLKRLKKQYPKSPWTVQAAPLIELVDVAEDLKLQNGNLKAANRSLTREVNELNKDLQQLKHLDLELEQKSR